jgi:hypothetical protein
MQRRDFEYISALTWFIVIFHNNNSQRDAAIAILRVFATCLCLLFPSANFHFRPSSGLPVNRRKRPAPATTAALNQTSTRAVPDKF